MIGLGCHVRWWMLAALRNLSAYPLRTALGVFGVMVGVASVVVLGMAGHMAREQTLSQFKHLGTDLLAGSLTLPQPTAQRLPTDVQLARWQHHVRGLRHLGVYAVSADQAWSRGRVVASPVVGVSGDFFKAMRLPVVTGRPLTALDHRQMVCVVGHKVQAAWRRQGEFQPLGQWLRVLGRGCDVVGVLASLRLPYVVFVDINRAVLLPLDALPQGDHAPQALFFLAQLQPGAEPTQVEANLRQLLYQWLKVPPELYVVHPKQLLASRSAQERTLGVLLSVIAAVTLLAGGVGVMNIMLVSVMARRQEIAIRMAVGATARAIVLLFWCEAWLLGLAGGMLGVLVGVLGALLLAKLQHWPMVWALWPMVTGLGVAVLVALIFGAYPALRAARQDPVVGLQAS